MIRAEKAKAYFLEGYNCAQAVAMAFDDLIGMDKNQIAMLTSGFGGGVGRMREVCGCVSGMAIGGIITELSARTTQELKKVCKN